MVMVNVQQGLPTERVVWGALAVRTVNRVTRRREMQKPQDTKMSQYILLRYLQRVLKL